MSAGDPFTIIVDGEDWLFEPLSWTEMQVDPGNRPSRVIRVTPPRMEPFEITLPAGNEHFDFSDDYLIALAIRRVG